MQDQLYPRAIQSEPISKNVARVGDSETEFICASQSNFDNEPEQSDNLWSKATSPEEYSPYLRVDIYLAESLEPNDLSRLSNWLRDVPAMVHKVNVVALFNSGSTILVLSMPYSLYTYLPRHKAIVPRDFVNSRNRFSQMRLWQQHKKKFSPWI